MIKNLKRKLSLCIASMGLLAGMFTSCGKFEEATITSFSFEKSKNSTITCLTKTCTGSINEAEKTITVVVPDALYDDFTVTGRKGLKATIGLGSAAQSIITDETKLDFSVNPVTVTVCSDSDVSCYTVDIIKAYPAVTKGNLIISEYYSDLTSNISYKGENNQYIEISNIGNDDLKLDSVKLVRHHWENGVRREDMDVTANLSGELKVGKSLVIYSNRATNASKLASSATNMISDQALGEIITVNGIDGFTLESNGKIIDALGPANGQGNGFVWGLGKKMERKAAMPVFTTYKEGEWLTNAVPVPFVDSFYNTAGKVRTVSDESKLPGNQITYFALENIDPVIYGTVSNTNKTIEVVIPEGSELTQYITASTDGSGTMYNAKNIVTGQTLVDFSKCTKEKPGTIYVLDKENQRIAYSLFATIVHYYNNTDPLGTYESMTDFPDAGDVILIANQGSNTIMGSSASGSKLEALSISADVFTKGKIEYEEGFASLSVSIDNEGYYVFTNKGKFLTSGATGNSLKFTKAPNAYSKWKIEKNSGSFIIVNANAKYNSNYMAIEYYSGYSSYNKGTTSVYKMNILKKVN